MKKFVWSLFLISLLAYASGLQAQGTAFTYQGRLQNNGSPANGSYDMAFALYGTSTGGVALAGPVTNTAVAVSNGLFTTTLDFGNVFTGGSNWLGMAVSPGGANTYSTLAPRQQLTAVPYAQYALSAGAAASAGSVSAANITGTIPLGRLPANVVTNGASGVNFTGTFSGDGAGVTNLPVSNLVQIQAPIVGWGDNWNGATTFPTGSSNVVAIAAGDGFSLALKSDGTVVSSRWNDYDQTTVPAGLSNVVAIAAGYGFSLALKSDRTVVAWGWNDYGQTTIPAGLSNVVAIAAGAYHSLALKSDGTVVGWGYNVQGQTTIPAGLSNVVAVAGGALHSLALKSDSTVVGWGYNAQGQTTIPAGLSNVVAIAAGADHNLALKSDGTVVGWGWNDYGETTIPAGLSNVAAIAAGYHHSLALRPHIVPAAVALRNGSNVFQGTISAAGFTGDGSGLTNLTGVALLSGGNVFTGNQVISSGNVGIGNANPTNILMVVNARCDGSSWINASDRNLKQDFAPVDAQTVLEKVAALPIQSWSYKAQPAQKHVGPVAQDFHAAFGLGQDETSIATVDEGGVALAAIQGLNQKLQAREEEIQKLKEKADKVDSLEKRVEELEKMIRSLPANK
ncbi:tail fiber domain-containing protein [Pedosphaera parvula]|nr:tail fiber domain-containing protein [Pedosphaera parvula]